MASTEENLRRFLKRELETVPWPRDFVLRSLQMDAPERVIARLKPDSEKWRESPAEEVRRLVVEILDMSKVEAQGAFHILKLELRCCIKEEGNDRKSYRASMTWSERGLARDVGNNGTSFGEAEPPTNTGVTSQLMRHNEVLMRMATEGMSAIMDSLKQENADLRRWRAKDEEEWAQRRLAMEKLLDRASDRDIKTMREKSDQARKDELMKQLATNFFPVIQKYIPGLIDKVIGGLGMGGAGVVKLPENATPAELAQAEEQKTEAEQLRKELREIVAALPEEQSNALFESLPEEQKMKLIGLVNGGG